jgi:hypothetical protein
MADLIKVVAPARRTVAVAAGVVGLVLAGLGIFFGLTRRNMLTQRRSAAPRAAIPPIDAARPARTETATFALG